MTKQCAEVLDQCDFYTEDSIYIEKILCRHSPKQIINFVWKKDPEGIHEIQWFLPFFKGYVKRVVTLDIEPDFSMEFFVAYDLCEKFEFTTFDMSHIQVMSSDVPRMKKAIERSKVQNLAYIRKVFEGIEPTKQIKSTKIDFVIGNSGTKVRND